MVENKGHTSKDFTTASIIALTAKRKQSGLPPAMFMQLDFRLCEGGTSMAKARIVFAEGEEERAAPCRADSLRKTLGTTPAITRGRERH